jgi:hypothetical protein
MNCLQYFVFHILFKVQPADLFVRVILMLRVKLPEFVLECKIFIDKLFVSQIDRKVDFLDNFRHQSGVPVDRLNYSLLQLLLALKESLDLFVPLLSL